MNKHSQPRQPRVVQAPHPVDSPYLTAKETVEYLRLGSRQALYRLIDQHGLPHGRRGRLHFFDKREIDAWVRGFSSSLELVRAKRA